jgi:hypothetical protein
MASLWTFVADTKHLVLSVLLIFISTRLWRSYAQKKVSGIAFYPLRRGWISLNLNTDRAAVRS